MATVADLMAQIIKFGKAAGKYAAIPSRTAAQEAALRKNVSLLNTNISALDKVLAAAPVAPVPDKAPDYGVRQEMSATLYAAWALAWMKKTFPDAGTFDPSAVLQAAKAAGCLAQVCASGVVGWPDGPYADLGDWSLYTSVVGTSLDAGTMDFRVYHMGQLVGEKIGGPNDGLAYAKSLGFDW